MIDKIAKKNKKVCLISSSGGHFEQIKMLKKLDEKYEIYYVTEKTDYETSAKYLLLAGDRNKLKSCIHLFINVFISLYYFLKENPDVVISTGTLVAFPTILFAKLFRRKVIYIETFARVYGSTKSAKLIYKYHLYDLFIYQWESQKDEFPNGVYGGGIY